MNEHNKALMLNIVSKREKIHKLNERQYCYYLFSTNQFPSKKKTTVNSTFSVFVELI